MHTVQRSAREISILYSTGDLLVNTREHFSALEFKKICDLWSVNEELYSINVVYISLSVVKGDLDVRKRWGADLVIIYYWSISDGLVILNWWFLLGRYSLFLLNKLIHSYLVFHWQTYKINGIDAIQIQGMIWRTGEYFELNNDDFSSRLWA